jgi:cytochrome c553
VLRGAGHYELGCRPCHGAPGTGLPAIPSGMTPHPPALSPVIPRWEPEDLFYIVKHGVKMTGMPAWPAQQRDDEVWAMVAFLRTLPELDAHGYERLVRGDITTLAELAPVAPSGTDIEPPRVVVEICARCHGLDGTGRGVGAFPRLAGQRERYLANALQAYAREERYSGIMGPIAAALPESAVADVSKYYAGMAAQTGRLQGPGAPVARDDSVFAQGAAIATRGVASQDIPSCADCHGPAPRNPAYPILSGQYAEYLVLQLELLQARRRGGSPYVRLMHAFVDRLSAEQIRAVASYYSSPPRQSPTSVPR